MMKLYIALGAAAVLLAAGFTAGWRVQGARAEKKLAAMQDRAVRAEVAYAQAVQNRQACEAELKRLDEAIDAYMKAGDAAKLEVAEAARKAIKEREWWQRRIQSLTQQPLPDDCAEAVRESARRIAEVERDP